MNQQGDITQPVLTDDQIEVLAKKHIAPHADRLDAILPNRVPYQQTEQFRRVKALIGDVLSKLRATVADERADDTLTRVYDRFGIGVLARNPSTLMACLGNVIRRARCLSQVEQVLSVPTPPEPEDDGVWGEESLLRWGADEKGYAEHFKAALAEWSRRAALASAPVAGEAVGVVQPNGDTFRLSRPLPVGTKVYAAPQASAEALEVARAALMEIADLADVEADQRGVIVNQALTKIAKMTVAPQASECECSRKSKAVSDSEAQL
ncbi:hypothetical protein ACOTJF_28340 [Achromobacter ruhlandii]|uniref:hypothetical protein n=1 Tax=Achromobacter ruhlandii TaxID=72557 RepID=UPI003B9E39BB